MPANPGEGGLDQLGEVAVGERSNSNPGTLSTAISSGKV